MITTTTQYDFVICSLPRMSMLYPPGAPAVLKAVLEKNNFKCKTFDFVADWFNTFKDNENWIDIDSWNAVSNLTLPDKLQKAIDAKIKEWAITLLNEKAGWIGLSVFSYESHRVASQLAKQIKSINPNQKILLGGAGITNISEKYAEKLLNDGWIDSYITGEGEESILQLAIGNTAWPGVNDKEYSQLSKQYLDTQPTPNFADYNLDLYGKQNLGVLSSMGNDIHTLPITSSRGCVRKCSYCDVPALWPKFTHRGGELVANEIIGHYEKSGIRKFYFTDSLVNGSMKDFRIMIDILAKYNYDHSANITWTGQFIFRPANQHTAEDWKTMAQAGASVLEVGIESGSDDIRFQMGKKFTAEDIEYEMGHAQKNKISTYWLMIVGYPTETERHFREYKEFFHRFQSYAKDKTIIDLDLGGTLRIQPNTPLFVQKEQMGIEMINLSSGSQEDMLWWNKTNPKLTLSRRMLRRFQLGQLALELGYTLPGNTKDLRYLWSKWNQLKNEEYRWLYARTNKN